MLLITPIRYNRIREEDRSTYPPVGNPVIRYSTHAGMPVYELVWNVDNRLWHCLQSNLEMPILPGDIWCEIPKIPDMPVKKRH